MRQAEIKKAIALYKELKEAGDIPASTSMFYFILDFLGLRWNEMDNRSKAIFRAWYNALKDEEESE